MHPPQAENLERELRFALQALALPARAQAAYHAGACTTCELFHDFVHAHEALTPAVSPRFTAEQGEALAAVYAALQCLPATELECWDDSALGRDGWDRLRGLAVTALLALGWPLEPPAPYRQVSPGVWQRP